MGKFRETLFLILATFYTVYLIIPVFNFYVRLDIGVVSIATFSGLFLLYPNAFLNKTTGAGVMYLAILIIYCFLGKDLFSFGTSGSTPLMRIIMATAFVVPNLAIYYILVFLDSVNIYKYFCWMPIIVILFSFLTFTPLIIGNKEVLRQVTYVGGEFSSSPLLPHYSLLHAYVFIMPPLMLAFKMIKKKTRYLFLLAAIYVFYVIAQSSVAATILLAIVSIGFMLVYDENSSKISLLRAIGFVGLFFILIGLGVVDAIMNFVVDMYEGTASAGKMRMFRDLLLGNELKAGNTFDERGGLHSISVAAFSSNPIFGSTPVGEHSCLLDRLGCLGLLGFIPYMIFLYSVIKNVTKTFNRKSTRVGFYLVSFSVLLMLFQKGFFGQECWLFFIVIAPSILHYIENEKKEATLMSR